MITWKREFRCKARMVGKDKEFFVSVIERAGERFGIISESPLSADFSADGECILRNETDLKPPFGFALSDEPGAIDSTGRAMAMTVTGEFVSLTPRGRIMGARWIVPLSDATTQPTSPTVTFVGSTDPEPPLPQDGDR